MKKLVLLNIIISVIILILVCNWYFDLFGRSSVSAFNKCDTVINHFRIDSIEHIIISKDSIINKIRINEQVYINKANTVSDSAAVELFKQLVSE